MERTSTLWLKEIRRRQRLMDAVMERYRVDVLKAVRADDGEGFFAARAKCRDCVHELDCRNWCLESSGSVPPNFCPNAGFFRACKRETDNELLTPNYGTAARMRLSDESYEKRASRELVNLIAKLHWLGEEEEEKKARAQLNRINARLQLLDGASCVASCLYLLRDTD